MGWRDRAYSRDDGNSWRGGGGSYGGGGFGGGGGGGPLEGIFRALNWSFPIGTVLDIRVRVHITFVILIAFELLGSRAPGWTLMWTGMLFGSVLLHEFGHCLACRRVGGMAHDILMWPLGGLASVLPPQRPWAHFVTTVWGPMVNLIIAALCFAALFAMVGGRVDSLPISFHPLRMVEYVPASFPAMLLTALFATNYALLLFNLALVFYPFDGGRLIQAVLWSQMGYVRSMRAASSIGLVGAILAGVFGLVTRQFMLIFIAVFGFMACLQLRQQVRDMDEFTGHGDPDDFNTGRHTTGRKRGLFSRWRSTLEQKRKARAAAKAYKLQAEVDRILKKVKDHGLQSLSEAEKRTLARATQEQRRAG